MTVKQFLWFGIIDTITKTFWVMIEKEGIYAYCSLNNTEQGLNAKELVMHKDVTSLSIYANKLKQIAGDVIHGCMLVWYCGANPGYRNIIAMRQCEEAEILIPTKILKCFMQMKTKKIKKEKSHR